MIACRCLVQGGQTPHQQQSQLEARLQAFSETAFGQPAQIDWIDVPRGNGFTASAPSTSSIVSMSAAEPLPQGRRAELLQALCDLWMEDTDCSLNEVVAVINDPN